MSMSMTCRNCGCAEAAHIIEHEEDGEEKNGCAGCDLCDDFEDSNLKVADGD